jgi:Na+/H+ antiporter NhaD/arsenite permease-like protein
MKEKPPLLLVLSLLVGMIAVQWLGGEELKASASQDTLIISGTVTNTQGKGVKDAFFVFYLNDNEIKPETEITTGPHGTYEAELRLPKGSLQKAKLALEVSKRSYKSSGRLTLSRVTKELTDEKGTSYYLAHKNLVLKRTITPAFWIATTVLIAVYVLIAFELMHRTLAAFFGAALILFISYTAGSFYDNYVILTFEDAVAAIDLNVIFLLMGMMIFVGVMKKTGVFQWLALKSYQVAKGNVFVLSAILMFITAFTSSFLDNVTTMLLIIPVTIEIAATLRINPITLLLPEVFASNIGGAATLIGDPPNIMIGSYAKVTFTDFLLNLSLICLICLAVSIVYFAYWYRKDYVKPRVVNVHEMIGSLREEYKIMNKTLLVQCLIVLGFTIFLFVIHGSLHMEPSIAAMTGAALLLVISRINIVEMLEHEIEWPTLIFFMMLFIVVAGAEETGLIQIVADWVSHMSGGSLVVALVMVLWVSALASSIIDNIPFTATMLPIVAYLNEVVPGAQSGILWWAFALGACLGGNGTMIGASANVLTVGVAERRGYVISFVGYLKVASVPTIITIILCTAWLLLVQM